MNTVTTIPIANLTFVFIPIATVIAVLWHWSSQGKTLVYATTRMIFQLLLIGFVLTFIFDSQHTSIVVGVLALMLAASSWIALRPLARRTSTLYLKALCAIGIGGVTTLVIVTTGVLRIDPFFQPRVMIPIAGMIFSNAMNTVSLTAERLDSELGNAVPYDVARQRALEAALIPLVNAFLAVGLVSLPGMMTGQILSGIEPGVAVRYQIMVMCMTLGAAGLAAIIYVALMKGK